MALASVAGERRVEARGRSGSRRLLRVCVLIAAVFAAMGLAVACVEPLSGTCAELRTCADASQDRLVSVDAAPDAGTDRAAVEGSAALDAGPDVALDVAPDVPIDRFVCDGAKDPKDEPCVLDELFGVFVAPALPADAGDASAGGDGSKSKPYPTIGQALAKLGGKTRIYVCNGVYTEQVSITTAVSIYGGLSCSAGSAGLVWTYAGGTAQVSSPSPAYALSVTGVSPGTVTIEDLSFTSPSATTAGGSSIAALASSSLVHLVRVTLTAGSGSDGSSGADGIASPNYTGVAPSGLSQIYTGSGGPLVIASGGPGGVSACLRYGMSAGGNGGLGCTAGPASPGLGGVGTSTPPAPSTIAGRDGLSLGAPLPDGGTATGNDPGADGLAGDGGIAATIYGTLSAVGWLPAAGASGAPGNPGQGGAGATDPLYGGCGAPIQSIGGGGGGAGGCGGAGGKGGAGGGASIALASLGSSIDLTECTLTAASGGSGGAGGTGQDGQAGAPGGDSAFSGVHAAGAGGGNGAGGSGGAGGTGGISVGILYQGSMITSDMVTNQAIRLGPPGTAGAAGPPGKHSTAGVFPTGMDGNPGALGGTGTSVAFLKLM